MTITNRADGANGFDPDFADPPQWAAMYRAVRFQPVPAWSPAERKDYKRPKLSEWRKIQGVILPQDQFDRIWAENATRKNMGVVTGECSDNLLVVDLDTQKTTAAADWWNGLLAVHNNNLPLETVEQRTGGGGRQLLFRAPPGRVVPTCKTPIGVDIRGHGGFAMLPPSMHESGHEYVWLPGQEPWELEVSTAPDWLLDAIDALVKQHGGGTRSPGMGEGGSRPSDGPEAQYDGFGQQTDGREETMRDVVWHAVLELYRQSPIQPPEAEWPALAGQAWEAYERRVDTKAYYANKRDGLEQEGRGPTLFWQKFQSTMRRWGAPEFVAEAAKPPPKQDPPDAADEFSEQAYKAGQQAKADPGKLLEVLDIDQIKAMADPVWLIDQMIIEQSLGFIYGPPGSVKTFFALGMALSIASGKSEWWTRSVRKRGAIVYISAEGQANLKFRIAAWEQHNNTLTSAADTPFFLIRQSINFMKGEDVGVLLETVEAILVRAKMPILAVFVDTVSRVLPGAEENLQKDMTLFVKACDAVRIRFGATVIGVHHTNAAGGFRGSTVMPGAGDFMIEMRREAGALEGSIFAKKIKDAEDGWEQHFRIVKIELGGLEARSSLVLEPVDEAPKREPQTAWPDRDICRQILAAIDEAWSKGRPWCYARNSSRCAIPVIMKRWQLKREIVDDILLTWTTNGVIAEEVCDAKNHLSGYRKLLDF